MPSAGKRPAAHMTFTLPESVKRRAQARRDVNWSAVVAQAIRDRLRALELMDKVLAASRLTQADVDELAESMDIAVAKRHGLVR